MILGSNSDEVTPQFFSKWVSSDQADLSTFRLTSEGYCYHSFTPESIQMFCSRICISNSDGRIEHCILWGALRDGIYPRAPCATFLFRPQRLNTDNFFEGENFDRTAAIHLHNSELSDREFTIRKEVWLKTESLMEELTPTYFRLFPRDSVGLNCGYLVESTSYDKDESGNVIAVQYTTSLTVSPIQQIASLEGEVCLYDRLFTHVNLYPIDKEFMPLFNQVATLNDIFREIITR